MHGEQQNHLHLHIHLPDWFRDVLCNLNRKADQIMATQAEEAEILRNVLDQQKKTATEVGTLLQKVSDLEAAIANAGGASPELIDAVAAVKAQAQVVDDLIPDAPVTPPDAAPTPTT